MKTQQVLQVQIYQTNKSVMKAGLFKIVTLAAKDPLMTRVTRAFAAKLVMIFLAISEGPCH
jgi:hypothetical protein